MLERFNIKLMRDGAKVPMRATAESAGYDVYASIDTPVEIKPHETVKVPLGFALEPINSNVKLFAALMARSGLAAKKGIRPANCVGVCDMDYRGEYIMACHNDSKEVQVVEPGERVAQLIFIPYAEAEFNVTDELGGTERNSGGFGSTGNK